MRKENSTLNSDIEINANIHLHQEKQCNSIFLKNLAEALKIPKLYFPLEDLLQQFAVKKST